MVLSHRYGYVFVEVPHTASTAISEELCRNYDGERILHKHASYNEFWEIASERERRYRVFAGVRHPMDDLVSVYLKFRHNHKGNFTNPDALVENGGWITPLHMERYRFIQDHDASFAEYFRRFYRRQYTNRFLHNRRDFTLILRFEHLQEDFSRMLDAVGADQVRPLPAVNPTTGKEEYARYYTPEIRGGTIRLLGPYMRQWGYDFPGEWGPVRVPLGSRVRYAVWNAVASLRMTHFRDRPLLRRLLRPVRVAVRAILPDG